MHQRLGQQLAKRCLRSPPHVRIRVLELGNKGGQVLHQRFRRQLAKLGLDAKAANIVWRNVKGHWVNARGSVDIQAV